MNDPPPNNILEELGSKYGATKLVHGYLRRYAELFHQRREDVKSVLEIGVQEGGSIRMWEAYFPNAEIFGIDIDPSYKRHEGGRRSIIIGDSTDPGTAERMRTIHPSGFDLIIDDGSHHPADQLDTFETFFPLLAEGGTYAIEDIGHTRGPLRLVANAKLAELIEAINYWPREMSAGEFFTRDEFTTDNYWIRSVVGLRFYRGLSFIEKGDNRRVTHTPHISNHQRPPIAGERPRFRLARLRELRLPFQFTPRRFVKRREVRPEQQWLLLLRWLTKRW